jgi:hypothetical protein
MTKVFVGRDRELRALEDGLAGGGGAEARLVLVTGEPGIGKTRLAEELTRKAESAGWLVAWGRSWEGEGTPAYFPWIQALRKIASAPALRVCIEDARAASTELDALVGTERGRTRGAPGDPAEARFRLFDAVTRALHRAAEEVPLVVVLDDIHAADLATLSLLHFVARESKGTPRLLLAATARDTAYQPAEGAPELLAKISREALGLSLGRLGKDDLARWMNEAAPSLASNVDDVFSVSDGNPLFVEELLAASRKRGALAWRSTEGLPSGVRQAIRAHVALLSPRAQTLLEAASAIGREMALPTLAAIEPDAAPLEEAEAAGVLLRAGDDRLRFAHVLLRDELYARVAPERRRGLHRRIAVALEKEPYLAVQHWLAGADGDDVPHAARVVLAAMREASGRLAFEDAAQLGERALGALRPLGLPTALVGAVEIALGEAWGLAGKADERRAACARAAEAAASIGDGAARAELLARAALGYAGERHHGGRDAEAIRLLRAALAALGAGDSALRAEVMARLYVALLPPMPGESAELHELARDATAMARRLGDDATTFAVLRFTSAQLPDRVEARERVAMNAEAISLAVRLGQVPRVVPVLTWQPTAWIEAGDPDAAARAADEAEELLLAFPQPQYRWRVPLMRAVMAAHEGRFADSDALGREALRIAQENDIMTGVSLFGVQRVAMQYARGDAEGFEEYATLYERTQAGPMGALFNAMPEGICGKRESVRERLTRAAPALRSAPGGGALGWACVYAGVDELAALFYEVTVAEAASSPWFTGPGGMASLGPRALLLGRLASILGRPDEALARYAEARALSERVRSPPYVAQTELAWAEALGSTDVAEALQHAEEARETASALGMRVVAARAEALARSLGSAPEAARPAPKLATPRTPPALSMVREGETWRIAAGERQLVLRDSKGLVYLEALVARPHEEIHVLALVGADDAGDAGPLLDERAKRAYRQRAAELREALEAATDHGDLGRAERARAELDALARELSRAVGLGGRDRRAASAAERARINVQRRIRDVLRRISEQDSVLGRHLERSVRTGVFCIYTPTWPG